MMQTAMIVGMVGTLLLGTIIGGLNSRFLDEADRHNEDLLDNLDGLNREVTLSEDSDDAKAQIQSLLHFNILRGAHCGILLNEANINVPELLLETKDIDGFENLPCDTQEEVINVNQPLDRFDSFLKSDYLEADGADQEGRYGNIKFTYPESSESPIIIDHDDFFRASELGQIVDIGDGITANAGPGNEDDWAGVYYRDANYGAGTAERAILYKPDPQIGAWAEADNKLDTPSPPYEDNYPYGEFVPVIENAPLVNSTPLSRELVGVGTNMESLLTDYEARVVDDEVEFDMVICNGSTGTIQANSGGPYQDGEATADGDEKRMYPFVRIDPGSPTSCVTDYVNKDSDYQRVGNTADQPKEFEIDMKLGDADYEGGRNSPCGPGRIRFYNENGDDFRIKFDGSDECDMEVNSLGWGSVDGDTLYVGQGGIANFRVVGGSDPRVIMGETEYELPNDKPVRITKVDFKGSGEGLRLNPDYFDGVIKKFEVNYGPAIGTYSMLDSELRDYMTVEQEGLDDSGWVDGEYRILAGYSDSDHQVSWDISSIDLAFRNRLARISCDGLEDAKSDETTSFGFQGKNFEAKCALNPMNLRGIDTGIFSGSPRDDVPDDTDIMSVEPYIKSTD
jgi:hypothetical protein